MYRISTTKTTPNDNDAEDAMVGEPLDELELGMITDEEVLEQERKKTVGAADKPVLVEFEDEDATTVPDLPPPKLPDDWVGPAIQHDDVPKQLVSEFSGMASGWLDPPRPVRRLGGGRMGSAY